MEISQTELLETQGNELQKKMHTHLPAKVVSFDAATQTVSIQIMIDQVDYNDEPLPLPPLVDVPVAMIRYGGFSITAAPVAGDEGLAHFSERCIDGWWESGRSSIPLDIRFHDLSDAFFEPFYSSKNNALAIIPNAMHLGASSTYIRIFQNGTIEINGNVNINGSVNVSGSIDANGDVVGQGVSLAGHTHKGVQSGSSETLPPTPTGG